VKGVSGTDDGVSLVDESAAFAFGKVVAAEAIIIREAEHKGGGGDCLGRSGSNGCQQWKDRC
jgi:hypothetical protein